MFDRNKRLDEIQKLIEQMLNFSNSNYGTPNLGEPSSIESFEEDGCTFEKKTWVTENGIITTIEMTNSPMDRKRSKPNKDEMPLDTQSKLSEDFSNMPLEVQLKLSEDFLKLAIDEERYEDAAKIRDDIKNIKKRSSEIVENQGVDEKDEWNF